MFHSHNRSLLPPNDKVTDAMAGGASPTATSKPRANTALVMEREEAMGGQPTKRSSRIWGRKRRRLGLTDEQAMQNLGRKRAYSGTSGNASAASVLCRSSFEEGRLPFLAMKQALLPPFWPEYRLPAWAYGACWQCSCLSASGPAFAISR